MKARRLSWKSVCRSFVGDESKKKASRSGTAKIRGGINGN
jgi:hypothetical protein